MRRIAMLAAMTLCGCGEQRRLPEGCYYGPDGTAVMKVVADEAVLLVPGPIKAVRLRWLTGSVQVTPAFHLVDLYRTEPNEEGRSARFQYRLKPKPSLRLPLAPAAYAKVRLGKPC